MYMRKVICDRGVMMTRSEERIKLVKAMEFLAWHLNDETIFEDWLALGVVRFPVDKSR